MLTLTLNGPLSAVQVQLYNLDLTPVGVRDLGPIVVVQLPLADEAKLFAFPRGVEVPGALLAYRRALPPKPRRAKLEKPERLDTFDPNRDPFE